jgi:hypothetical protein
MVTWTGEAEAAVGLLPGEIQCLFELEHCGGFCAAGHNMGTGRALCADPARC